MTLLATLAERAQLFLAETNPVALLDLACRTIRDDTGAGLAIAVIADESGTRGELILSSGCDEDTLAYLRAATELPALFREVVLTGRPIECDRDDARVERIGLPASHPPITAFLVVPLASSSRVHGVVVAASLAGGTQLSKADEDAALVLAGLTGMAYENALLINQLKAHEAKLQDTHTINEFVLEATGVGLYQRDLKTEQATASRSLTALLGLDGNAGINDLRQRIFPEDREVLAAATARALTDRADYYVDVRVQLKDGAKRDIYARGRVTADADGAPDQLLGAFIDITERRQLEAQLRQAQKMEIIGRLAGGVAHDFNNMLTVISGYARFVEPEVANEQARRDLGEVLKAVERATGMTRQLLAFSRKRARDLVVFDVNAMITGLATLLHSLLGELIKPVVILDPQLPPIHADRGQIEQVLLNLAINARDAMPRGGELRITTERRAADGVDQVCIVVSDTGSGMTPEVITQIFEPFFTTKSEGKGTGLGLATVLAIVTECGGRIDVDSAPGKGAAFTILLPSSSAMVTPVPAEAEAAPGGHERVLLVEDDDGVRALVRSILTRAGYTVHAAAGLEQASSLGEREPIDVVVSDVLIAGGTGPDVYRRVSESRPGLRVLYVSGYAVDTILDTRALDTHAAFLPKPFTANALLQRLRLLLDRP